MSQDIRPGIQDDPTQLDDDQVARLLDLAGPRPAVPPEVAAQVKAAARAEWQRTVAAHQRRSWQRRGALLAIAATLLLVVVGGAIWRSLFVEGGGPVATVEVASTGVTVTPEAGEVSSSANLAVGTELSAGAWIETAAVGDTVARAALRLRDGGALRLDRDSRLRLVSATELELERGAVYIDAAAGEPLAVRTAFGIARDIGTQFEVRLVEPSSSLRIRVREGLVELDRDGDRHTAAAGDELAVLADGSLVRGTVPAHGPSWDWVLAALPAFEIDGRSVAEVLTWAAREGGWQLHYADSALAELAAEIRIYGPPAGSDLEDTVAAALKGSGLAHQLENGRLSVLELPAETE